MSEIRFRGSKNLLNYRKKLASCLNVAAGWLVRNSDDVVAGPRYVDLAPTDQADPVGAYSAALTQATNSPRVMNIALTGPYGSGKSSIIKSFLKNYKRPALQISLAAFLADASMAGSTSGTVSPQEIERSILQQMLYGVDAKRLPLSRFKRIQSPGSWSMLASLFMIVGVIACWYLLQKRDALIAGAYFFPFDITNWFNLLAFAIGGVFIWQVVHRLYVASFGISLKSISLKDVEITPKAATEESILNRHLDEIIYFFQSTKYDLVVIEDLDRFNSPEIFVTLREINSLVNANLRGKRHIRFLYALRDDMFMNVERTKFFEFIIPVIPIINASNSIDKVLEQGKRLSLEKKLNHQFLLEVSRYLNDFRLIQNIFNEYAIYIANLEVENEGILNVNKLLAVLIYKNVFPKDFEDLHRGKGNLAEILRSHDLCIAASETRYKAEISEIEDLIEYGEKQLPHDVAELRRIYAMALIEKIPNHFTRIGFDQGSMIEKNNLAKYERLEEILEARELLIATQQGNFQTFRAPELQVEIDPRRKFRQRVDDVNKKSAAFKDESHKKIREIRAKLGALRMAKFNEVMRENLQEVDILFDKFREDADLARFLVLEGHLDDTYYQYTSLFHSGRLSPSDNKFLILIRGFRTPDPDFQIDNPKEVIAAMRDEDFSRSYVLNVTIVDSLLADPSSYAAQNKRLFDFIASDFAGCEAFLSVYYSRGTAIKALISGLTTEWPEFVSAAVTSPGNLMHVARMLGHLSNADLKGLSEKQRDLTDFTSKKLADILAQGVDFPAERLEALGVETTDLAAVGAYPSILRFLFEEGLYQLSAPNLDCIFRSILCHSDADRAREQNYTMVLESESASLLRKVDDHFGEYLENILLASPDNSRESVIAIHRVIEREDVELESIVEFLEKQSTLLPNLDSVPPKLYCKIFQVAKIEATWENCLAFLISPCADPEILTEFLNRTETIDALAGSRISDGKEAKQLRSFIFENDGLSRDAYETYVAVLPKQFNVFPENINEEKTKILIDRGIITFSPGNLAHLSAHLSLGVAFVVKNIADFFEVESECAVDDDFRQEILSAEISDASRLKIIRKMDPSLFVGMSSRAAIVGSIIARTGVKLDDLAADAARAMIVSSQPLVTQISLLNMLHEMFDDRQLRDILQSLPDPLPEIMPGFARPTIEGSEVNLKFVAWLRDRRLISSWSRGPLDGDIRMNMFRK